MNEQAFEQLIAWARPVEALRPNEFTTIVLAAIHTGAPAANRADGKARLLPFAGMRLRLASMMLILLAVLLLGFSGYSYAVGSNPVSLLKRWVIGNQVRVQYQGHTFTYGKQRT